MALPTPADVKDLPLSPGIFAAFAAVPDYKVQRFIDNCASWFGSAEVKQHTQRNEAILYGAGHLLYLALVDEGVLGGGGGGNGAPVSSQSLQGVGSISWAVQAPNVDQIADWLKRHTPFQAKLNGILATFPPGIWTAQG